MTENELKDLWLNEEKESFSGWDFTRLDGRWESEPLRWDYKKKIQEALLPTDKLLDMGTGGGEFLLSLNHPPQLTAATEGYIPNFKLCRKKLMPLGIEVRHIKDDRQIPFDENEFDIVINRHESFDVNEVHRVLKPGGMFITQQVGGKNNRELSKKIINNFTPKYATHQLSSNVNKLRLHGFDVFFSDEQLMKVKFFDVGALVYYAKIIEWEFPNFSVEEHFSKLLELQSEIEKKGYVASTWHRFIIVARSY